MAGGVQDNEEEITGINVTPLVDVVLVLLIIFMVTANFIVRETVEVDLPKAANGGETVQGLVNVVMDKEGKLYFDGAEVSETGLVERVKGALEKDKDTRAVISADQSIDYGRVMRLIDVVKGQGIAKFALNIQKGASAPLPAAGAQQGAATPP
jgi:biopolymer transport protein ExbD